MLMSVLLWLVCYVVTLTRQGPFSVLKDVKRDCICILIQNKVCSVFYFLHIFLLKLRQVLKLSLNVLGSELVFHQLEVENYMQNKCKIDF